MVVEALSEKGEEKSTVKSASDSLLELCRGLKKSKSVGMIALDSKSPDYVPSLPKPSFKSVLMNFRIVGEGQEHKPVSEPKPQERGGKSRVSESDSEKEPEEIRNVEKVMSKRKMTKPKNKKIQNDKNIFQNLNDVHILNDVEKEGNLCGPENSGNGKVEATHDVGGGSESEKDEIEEDSNAESWDDTRVKSWLRPRVKTRRMNESAPESFWRQGTSGPRSVLFPGAATSDPPPHSKLTCRSCRLSSKMSSSSNADAMRSPRRGSPASPAPPFVLFVRRTAGPG